MKRIKTLIILILLIISCTTTVIGAEPEITATSAVVVDCIDGKVLYSKEMNEKLYPASMTKVLTAILVMENCNMEDEVTMSQSAINNVQQGYLTANIKAGEVLTVEQFLNLLLISSYNDVANVLAEHIGGSIEHFSVMMNEKAKEIGCTNSNFTNPCGAHDVNHYSTAYDMALIGIYAMRYDKIKDIVDETTYQLNYSGGNIEYYTTNDMIKSSSVNYYKYARGIKTGFTTPAGHCLMTYAEKNDMPIVSVVMKSTTSNSRYQDSKQILEYSYANNSLKTIALEGTCVQTITVKNGTKDTQKTNAVIEKDVIAVVNDATEVAGIEPNIIINENIKAPVKKGDVLGSISYEIEGKKYVVNLVAESEVKPSYKILIFSLMFLGIMLLLGSLRIASIKKRNKVLEKIRGI